MLRLAGVIAGWFILVCMVCWAGMAIFYSNLPAKIRPLAAALFVGGSLVALMVMSHHDRAVISFLILFASVLAWWLAIPPLSEREWQPDVAVLPSAVIKGDVVTVHNIRNAEYRTTTDYTVRYYDAAFDLRDLRSVDIYLVYWGSAAIAHTMMSFGFGEDRYICFSVETRKRRGQEYSAIKGFFKQYELICVVADERDVVRLRTTYRREDVYLFRLMVPREAIATAFLDYLQVANRLSERPEWYNALTNNCTLNIGGHTAPYNPRGKWDWRIIFNGYVDRFMYEEGVLDRTLPLAELKKRSLISGKAREAGDSPEFSARIRSGLPGF